MDTPILLIDGDPFLYKCSWQQTDVESALRVYRVTIHKLQLHFFTFDIKVAFTGTSNFRYDVTPDYKKTDARGSSKRLFPLIKPMKEALVRDGDGIIVEGLEADDVVRIWSEEERTKGKPFVVISADKDLRCIPGTHYCPNKKEEVEVSEMDASMWFHQQLLMGDPVDNIKGLYNVGKVKSKKMLEKSEDHLQTVVDAYYEEYGDSWKKELEVTGKLVYLLKSWDDGFTIPVDVEPSEAVKEGTSDE